jgi:colanic acid biosynthesis protein WcaH
MSPAPLSYADLSRVVRLAPLVSIDLIIRNARNEVLLGLRNNEPAKGCYFVPGGSIWKNERLRDAFARILNNETNCAVDFDQAQLLGVYEHLYPNNRFGDGDYGTHYVVLGYQFKLSDLSGLKTDAQHSEFAWWTERDLLASPHVHDNTKAYFREPAGKQ